MMFEGRNIYLKFTIAGTGGLACFSQIAPTIEGGCCNPMPVLPLIALPARTRLFRCLSTICPAVASAAQRKDLVDAWCGV